MVKNVVRSTALYGRLSENILVQPLEPFEVAEFIGNRRGHREILEYLICFGGVPRYLEEFDFNKSIRINIEKTCFQRSGFFVTEADGIFYSQFKETRLYKRIVQHLLKGPLLLKEIAQKTGLPSSGGLKQYCDNLILARMLEEVTPIQDFKARKVNRYEVSDEFLRFHAQFIQPHEDKLRHASSTHTFEEFTQDRWHPFAGLAFERFCRKHRYHLAKVMGFENKVTSSGPFLDQRQGGFQYDLAYLRNDGVVTLCEVKYLKDPPGTPLIREMEAKLKRTNFPKGLTVEKVLLCNQEPSPALRESGYFHTILDFKTAFLK
jgi:hypothetical protein